MRKIVLLVSLLAVCCRPAPGEQAGNAPDRVILGLTPDPARSMAVNWRMPADVAESFGQLVPAQGSASSGLRTVKAKRKKGPATDVHACFEVVLTGLKPSTRYRYRVGREGSWSAWSDFTTASEQSGAFSFIYLGDVQNGILVEFPPVIRAARKWGPEARFVLYAGDLVNRGERDEEWAEWFQAVGWLHRTIPAVPVVGNHEYTYDPATQHYAATTRWGANFALPRNGPKGLKDTVAFMDYQGVRIVVLDSNCVDSEQTAWLTCILSGNPNRWTIVSMHHPVYPGFTGRDDGRLRRAWQPLFDRYNVDLVLQGHDHMYARTGPMRYDPAAETGDAEPRPVSSGPVYVISVAGSKMYPAEPLPYMRHMVEDLQTFQIVTVKGVLLTYESRTVEGRLQDSFTLHKPGQGRARLVERKPDSP